MMTGCHHSLMPGCRWGGHQLTITYPLFAVAPWVFCWPPEPPAAPRPAFAGMPAGRRARAPRSPAVPAVYFAASPAFALTVPVPFEVMVQMLSHR